MTAAEDRSSDRDSTPVMPIHHYFGRSRVAAAEGHLSVMERWLEYYQDRRKEAGSRDEDGIATAQAKVDRAKADVELQRELKRLEDDEKRARGGWYGTETAENQARYLQAQQNLLGRAVGTEQPERSAGSGATDCAVRDVVPPVRFTCLEGPALDDTGTRRLAESHESVLAALVRILFDRRKEQEREEPWSRPCCRAEEDDRGAAR